MGNRLIHESIHESEKLNSLTDFQFRVWVGLLTYVDDYGRGDARPAIIKGNVFPLRERITLADIEKTLQSLAGVGCISLYTVNGKPYLCFPNWEKYQRIRQKVSRYPEPPDSLHSEQVAADCGNVRQIAADCGELPQDAAECGKVRLEYEYNKNTNTNTNTKEKGKFVPPTLEDVREYCIERGSKVDPVKFFDYFTAGGWKDSKGNPVKNWKQKLLTWEAYQPKEAPKQETGNPFLRLLEKEGLAHDTG